MSVDDRIELLKKNILHFTKDLLHFDVVEIRLLDGRTGKLEPLLAVGIDSGSRRPRPVRPAAEQRRDRLRGGHRQELSVRGHDRRPACIWKAAKGAKSSLTVPLILHDEVIGTFNVESPEPRAFSESDLQFLEIFTPRRGRGAEYAGTAGGREGHHGAGKRRGDSQRRGPAGRRNPQRRRQHHGALHRPRARGGRAVAGASCGTPATSSS